MAKLNFIESQHPRMLSYVECRSDPVFYLVEDAPEPEPESPPLPQPVRARLAVMAIARTRASFFFIITDSSNSKLYLLGNCTCRLIIVYLLQKCKVLFLKNRCFAQCLAYRAKSLVF